MELRKRWVVIKKLMFVINRIRQVIDGIGVLIFHFLLLIITLIVDVLLILDV